jgi:hypothetical protein
LDAESDTYLDSDSGSDSGSDSEGLPSNAYRNYFAGLPPAVRQGILDSLRPRGSGHDSVVPAVGSSEV